MYKENEIEYIAIFLGSSAKLLNTPNIIMHV
jgi:hypothetical protein